MSVAQGILASNLAAVKETVVTDLIDTTEMYLRTILELEEEGIVPLRARIAEHLGHSGPTVSQTVARMERDGLVHVEGDRHLALSTVGREKATAVMRKHRIAERLLSDVIGLDWALVHDEACRWEHVMSDAAEMRIIKLLGTPSDSPYGNPIPGLETIGLPKAPGFRDGVVRLTDALAQEGSGEFEIRRMGEPVQFSILLLRTLFDAGVVPLAHVHARLEGDKLYVGAVDGDTEVAVDARDVGSHIFVAGTDA